MSVQKLARTYVLLCFFLFSLASHARENPGSAQKKLSLETFDTVWQKIYEHHFDTNFNGHDWLKVREEYRPRAAAAENNKQLRDVLQEMIDLLHVSHMAIVPGELSELIDSSKGKDPGAVEQAEEEDSGTLGLQVRFVDGSLMVTRAEPGLPAGTAGVQPGWIIKRIGGVDVQKLLPDTLGKLDEQRRQFLAWRAASHKLSGAPGSNVELEFLDAENHPRTLQLTRARPQGEAVQFGNLPVLYAHFDSRKIDAPAQTRIGLIRFDIWLLPTALAFNRAVDEFRDADGIIIDLRGNIGGMVGMIIGTAGHFLREPKDLGALVARDNTFHLPANPRFVGASGQPVTPYAGPVAILVDEITASASEVFTGAMQELGRVRVFGRRTSGQALPAMLEELPNGDAFYHPVSDFVTPKGTRFEGRGVIPDMVVPLKRQALLADEDRTLEAAVQWITEKDRADEVVFQEPFGDELRPGWKWIREEPQAWRLRANALEILIQPGNMWGPENSGKNVLVRSLPSADKKAVTVSMTVEHKPTHQYEQADLVCYFDDSHMVKIGEELVDGQLSVVMGREEEDKTRTIKIIPLQQTRVQLRLRIHENKVTGEFRPNASGAWQTAGTCDLPAPGTPAVAIQCYQGDPKEPHWARIEQFTISQRAE